MSAKCKAWSAYSHKEYLQRNKDAKRSFFAGYDAALAEAQEENKRLCEELSRQTIDLGVVRNSGAQAVKCAVAKTEAAEKERDELRTQLSDEMDLNAELTAKIERLDAKWRDYESAMVAWRESKQAADVVIDELRAQLKAVEEVLVDVCQVFDGWHQDGASWSAWDESVRLRCSAALDKYEAGG